MAAVAGRFLSSEAETAAAASGGVPDAPSVVVQVVATGATGRFYLVAENAGKDTFMHPEGQAVVLRGGGLVGTRGFGNDMMGGAVPPLSSILRDGARHRRVIEVLDGQDQITTWVFDCETARKGDEVLSALRQEFESTVFEETCTNDAFTFSNRYWRGRGGQVLQSLELASPALGYVAIVRI
ncbi:hypothetical protein EU803_10460 [Loktanella sp. IMCC34160]|uniref:YjbF family lipoprotein n=1 Tax=Loktanella sp. IMCC34160 TaxID=2510646 RepID=UPI00101DDE42|nr:YjbF family lipoprotein [Loktanella sp. IMCC34160]RYG91504.1 hypothetical protein EU803_10460 [Loktanella sp. IMCC34160]